MSGDRNEVAAIVSKLHPAECECMRGDPDHLVGSVATLLTLSLLGLADTRRDRTNVLQLNEHGRAVRASLLKVTNGREVVQ